MKDTEKLKSDNEDLKTSQKYTKQKIRYEVEAFINNEVKSWKEGKEKDEIKFKEIFEPEMEHKGNIEKKVIKVIETYLETQQKRKRI